MKATKFSQYLQAREELKYVDRPHWIYVVEAVLLTAIIFIAGFLAKIWLARLFIYPTLAVDPDANGFIVTAAAYIASMVFWGAIIWGTISFLYKIAFYLSTYVFASDRRLFMKTGMIRVLVHEISYDEVRKSDINYGLFGRFLGYGKLMMDARFVEDIDLPFTYNPEIFAKIIHYENDLVSDVNLSYATKGHRAEADRHVPKESEMCDHIKPMREQVNFADHAFTDQERVHIHDTSTDVVMEDFDEASDSNTQPSKKLSQPTPHRVDLA